LFVLAAALALGRERGEALAGELDRAGALSESVLAARSTAATTALAREIEPGAARAVHEIVEEHAVRAVGGEPRVRLFGRALDREGRAVAQAGVRLELRELVLEHLPPPVEPHTERAPLCFTTRTHESGNFALSLPLIDDVQARLQIDASDAPASAIATFHWFARERGEPLIPGDLELGEFVLQPTTKVTGRVLDAHGAPLVGATVSSDLFETATTAADGSYCLERALVGEWVGADKLGYLGSTDHARPANSESTCVQLDLHLTTAPTIRGFVRDDQGRALSDVLVVARDEVRTCRGNWIDQHTGRSAADGSFELRVAARDGYHLEARHRAPLRFWDEGLSRREFDLPRVQPGATDVQLVLAPPRSAHFEVRDARTGEPIERFGIAAADRPPVEDSWRDAPAVPRIGFAASGTLQLELETWETSYRCEAPGYAPASGAIEDGSSAERPQRIELEPGARLRGRVRRGAHAPVVLERQPMRRHVASTTPSESGADGDWEYTYDLDTHAGRERTLRCAADESFAFDGLAEGTYRLLIFAAGRLPTQVENLRIRAGQTLELGELAANAPASIEGVVRVAAGSSPAGLVVTLEGEWQSRVLAGDGRFEFADLVKGDYVLRIDDHPELCFSVPSRALALEFGENAHVEWDLMPWQPAQLTVRVTDRGRPVQGVDLALERDELLRDDFDLGETDEAGRVSCKAPLVELPILIASSPWHVPLGRYPLHEALRPGAVHELELALECGALELSWSTAELPAAFFADANASIELVLVDAASLEPIEDFSCLPAGQGDGDWLTVAANRELRIDRIAAGSWRLDALTTYELAGVGTVEVRTSAEIEIRAGATTRARMRP